MFFSLDSKYKYLRKADFYYNFVVFSKLYTPLLSSNAYKLYSYMCSEISIYDVVKSYQNKISEICLVLNLKEEEFHEARKNLEALELLKTFSNKEDVIYFEIIEPLEFKEFTENLSLRDLFIDKVGKNYYHKLVGQLSEEELTKDYKDISCNLEAYFKDQNINLSKKFNFEKLYANLSSFTSINVSVSDEAKETIEYYFRKYNLTFQEVERIVFDSLVKEKNNFTISKTLLESEFKKLCGQKDLSLLETIVPINRNKNMFIEKSSITSLQKVFHDYKNLTPEQYLSSIYNSEISEEELSIINEIRNQFRFPDYIINIMIDFSLPITHSELNLKYLKKMGKTFKVNNVSSLEEIYDFLFKWKNRESLKKQSSSKRTSKKQSSEKEYVFNEQKIEYDYSQVSEFDDSNSEEDLVSLDF